MPIAVSEPEVGSEREMLEAIERLLYRINGRKSCPMCGMKDLHTQSCPVGELNAIWNRRSADNGS